MRLINYIFFISLPETLVGINIFYLFLHLPKLVLNGTRLAFASILGPFGVHA